MKNTYYITIHRDGKLILNLPFPAKDDKDALAKMDKLISIWCEDGAEFYSTNLYRMVWINGV